MPLKRHCLPFGVAIFLKCHSNLFVMKWKSRTGRELPGKISLLLVIQLVAATVLQAQRGIPVPVPPGARQLFPDWLFYVIFGIIALLIIVKFMEWFITRFRDFRSFSELVALAGGIAATWISWRATGWGFGWCLLAGYVGGLCINVVLDFLFKQIAKRN